MKNQSGFQFSIAGVALVLLILTTSTKADEEKYGPTQIADALHEALTAGDQEQIFDVIAPDVLIFESGGVEASREEYASHHMHSDMKFMAGMDREIISRQVTQDGAMAVVSTSSKLVGSYQDNQLDLASTETLVLKKGDHGWRIHHIHWSSKSNN